MSTLSFRPTNSMAFSPSSPCKGPSSPVMSCSFRTEMKKKTYPNLGCGLVRKTDLFGSRNSNFQTLRRSCSNGYKGFSDDDMSEQIKKLNKRPKRKNKDEDMWVVEMSKKKKFNRDLNLARKGFPISLPETPATVEADEEEGQMAILDYSSVKKAFSSMVFMIQELQSYALHIREHLTCEDLQGVVTTVQREMNASFVWLFQQVFVQTPMFMVFVMILMANFTVHSMTHNAAASATVTAATQTMIETEKDKVVERDGVGLPAERTGGRWELAAAEMEMWKSVEEEAMLMRKQSGGLGLDHETMKRFVSPMTVEIEKDDYEEFFRTDLLYQIGISQEPNNPLLLSNYARFLYLVFRDHDRAEQCFKRAVMAEPPDAEALSSYADYLWVVKKDLWKAEERFQQAMEVDPQNSHHSSKYANFLWSTGAEDTCFPLQQQQDDGNPDQTT